MEVLNRELLYNAKQTVVKNSENQINEKVSKWVFPYGPNIRDIGARVILILMMGEGLDY